MVGGSLAPSPPGVGIGADQYVDPVVVSFCIAQERIIGVEAKIITERFGSQGTQQAFRRAARMAERQVPILIEGDRPQAARAVKRWEAALRKGALLTSRGLEGYEALKPAIAALNEVNDQLSCELDLDDPVPEADENG